jgi:transposase
MDYLLEALEKIQHDVFSPWPIYSTRSHKVFGRYIRQTKAGKLKLDKAKIATDAQLESKYLVSTSEDGFSAEEAVSGCKQLATIERVLRDLKHLIDIGLVNHRLDDRIRAHVLLCWLAMLLIRVTENEVQKTWFQLKKLLSTIQPGIMQLPEGKVQQSNL